jgi:protein-tyrosine-phosphatase
MNILFLCRYNRFRSVIAEGFFKKLNKNTKYKAKSAGLIIGRPIDQNTKNIARKLGIKIKKKPEGLSTRLLGWQDLLVIVADDVPEAVFKNKEYIKKIKTIKIKDANIEDSINVVKMIEFAVKLLVKKLSK